MKKTGLAGSWETSPAGLVILDADGVVLPRRSSWQVLHETVGVGDAHEDHYQQFNQGEISFAEWGRKDAELWEGEHVEKIREAGKDASVREYFYEMVTRLRKRGLVVGIVSAGVHQYLADVVERSDVDFVVANELEVKDGQLTGRVDMQVTNESKADWVSRLAQYYSVPLDRTVAAGDTEHDLQKFATADWSIAFAPESQEVEDEADETVLEEEGLRELCTRIERWHEKKSTTTFKNPTPER